MSLRSDRGTAAIGAPSGPTTRPWTDPAPAASMRPGHRAKTSRTNGRTYKHFDLDMKKTSPRRCGSTPRAVRRPGPDEPAQTRPARRAILLGEGGWTAGGDRARDRLYRPGGLGYGDGFGQPDRRIQRGDDGRHRLGGVMPQARYAVRLDDAAVVGVEEAVLGPGQPEGQQGREGDGEDCASVASAAHPCPAV